MLLVLFELRWGFWHRYQSVWGIRTLVVIQQAKSTKNNYRVFFSEYRTQRYLKGFWIFCHLRSNNLIFPQERRSIKIFFTLNRRISPVVGVVALFFRIIERSDDWKRSGLSVTRETDRPSALHISPLCCQPVLLSVSSFFAAKANCLNYIYVSLGRA